MSSYIVTRDDSKWLQHFGILGQKWGIRRFENPDGTLTEEGKARYSSNKEQKKLANKISKNYTPYEIEKAPQVKDAIQKLKSAANKSLDAEKALDLFSYETNIENFNEKFKSALMDIAKADKEYDDVVKNYASQLVGEYGNELVKVKPKYSSDDVTVKERTTELLYGLSRMNVRDDYQTAEKYSKAGEKKIKKYGDAANKYTQDEGVRFSENDPRMKKLREEILKATKASSEKESKIVRIFGGNFDKKNDMANWLFSKAYYEWSSAFDKTASEYIDKNFKPNEQELARAALFWDFFD